MKNRLCFEIEAVFCDPAEDRTQDPQIKSLLLYQLSYGVIRFGGAKKRISFVSHNQNFNYFNVKYD